MQISHPQNTDGIYLLSKARSEELFLSLKISRKRHLMHPVRTTHCLQHCLENERMTTLTSQKHTRCRTIGGTAPFQPVR